jgi:hypothetical protein
MFSSQNAVIKTYKNVSPVCERYAKNRMAVRSVYTHFVRTDCALAYFLVSCDNRSLFL